MSEGCRYSEEVVNENHYVVAVSGGDERLLNSSSGLCDFVLR